MEKLDLENQAGIQAFCSDFASDDVALDRTLFPPTRSEALARLAAMRPAAYAKSRNYLTGAVTQLSPYLRHGLVSLREAVDQALASEPAACEKLVQELAWRDFWQRKLADDPDAAWVDIEDYKTGFKAGHYLRKMPIDVIEARTPSAAMNAFIVQLHETGYLHNHARMYLAAYLVHWRHVAWQTGAAWFLEHLLDGDLASNNLSWQWIASTFANKPYFFNLENLTKYCGTLIDCRPEANSDFDASYEVLFERLFPKLEAPR